MKYHLYINDTIGWPISADYVRAALRPLEGKPIDVYVSSLGGDVATALEIRQMFAEHGEVTCHLHGFVASAATILATGAKTIKMGRFALFMIHRCSAWQEEWGMMNADELAATIAKLATAKNALESIDRVIGSIYAARTGKPIEECAQMMQRETWMSADEALAAGFVDEILSEAAPAQAAAASLSEGLRARIAACGLPIPEPQAGEIIPDNQGLRNPAPSLAQPAPASAPAAKPSALERLAARVAAILGRTPEPKNQEPQEPNNPNPQEPMHKSITLSALCALLSVENLAQQEDGSVQLSEEQLRMVENQLAAHASVLADRQTQLDALTAQVASLQAQVRNLQSADGDETPDAHAESEEPSPVLTDIQAAAAAQASYERLKGIL